MNDKVSVIIPIYNVEQYLEKCLECVTKQTYPNLEIILVEDGSPDNCGVICDEWRAKDDRILVIHKENGGVSSARNIGLSKASGDWISFLDPDDIIHPRYYEILLGQVGYCDCVLCRYIEFSNGIEFDSTDDYYSQIISSDEAIKLGMYRHPEIFYVVWNKLIKSNLAKSIKFDQTMKNGEDTIYAFDVIRKSSSISVVNGALYGYYIRADGAVKNIDIIGKMNILKMAEYIYQSLSNYEDSELRKRSRDVYFYTVVNTYWGLKKSQATNEINYVETIIKKNILNIMLVHTLSSKEKIYLMLKILS